jgi:S-DNA-T family DNA segregation ATPase FtsK/SpoIIIE
MPPRSTTAKPRKRPVRAKRSSFAWPTMPKLEQRHMDLIGLGLVALASYFAFVFYLGWDGGKVGFGLQQGFTLLFGKVGYLAPIALFGFGAILVLRPVLPTVQPFKAGSICFFTAMVLGFAAGSFGMGPERQVPAGTFDAAHLRDHGGAIGEALYAVTKTLFQQFGTNILFLFVLTVGVLLLTGASVAGVVRATHDSVSQTTRRVRQSTSEFAAVVSGQKPKAKPAPRKPAPAPELDPDPIALEEPDPWDAYDEDDEPPLPPDVEPIVRATHVEAPVRVWEDDEPEAEQDASELHHAPEEGVTIEEPDFEPPAPVQRELTAADLTPQGRLRSNVTEADDFTYTAPSQGVLKRSSGPAKVDRGAEERTARILVEALGHFGVESKVVGTISGPHITRYEVRLAPGIKMSKVSALKDDLAYALAATDVRILAPIPGKQAVGIEVPNEDRKMVHLGDVYQEAPAGWSPLTVWLGKDIAGKAIGTDLAKQPHILVAGTTGSGKSGCVNAMLSSILLHASPNDVRMVLIDPKQVELNLYESIPHLLTPVVTSPRLAANVLQNLIKEMESRYTLLSRHRVRNIIEMNRLRVAEDERPLPYILCVIDELADLMMVAPGEVEDSIIRLAQKSRAVGIHLVLATQRPSVDIITGMIKTNVPARIAFAVSSGTDSRVILDQNGAESLLGQGDMLFRPASESRPARIQGAFIDESEIERIVAHWKKQGEPEMHEELLEAVEPVDGGDGDKGEFDPDADDLLSDAIATVVQMGTASTSMLQRRLRVGYTRAGRLIDMMERRGVISGYEGSKARQVLITEGDLPRVLAAIDEPVGAGAEQ